MRLSTEGNLRTCLASTTEHVSEYIENTLIETSHGSSDWESFLNRENVGLQIFSRRNMYWSSRPSDRQDTDESLLFITRHPDSIISEVWVKPLTDPYFEDRHYTWKNMLIQAYHLEPKELDMDEVQFGERFTSYSQCVIQGQFEGPYRGVGRARDDDKIIEKLLVNQKPVFESQILGTPPDDCVDWQHFTLPNGIVGNVVIIRLIGKNSRQFDESGYYSCVDRVAVRGIPLYKNVNQVETWNSPGTLMLLTGS